ncbi:MAG: hypothetical protein NZ954_02490 [Thermofilaceae archaeon]|nr:hypothetical protein [Thermofilaceae archaeon]MDW8003543.1 uroporphyrinogen decarboxylase family protein [Thermofilaceae archaeon]
MFESNFERLLSALRLEEPSDRVPFYDLYADTEIVETLTGEKLYPQPYSVQSVVESLRDPVQASKLSKLVQHNTNVLVRFYGGLGYDYVTFSIPTPFPRANVLLADDTAPLRRTKRVWNDESRGTIESREDYVEYQWPDDGEVVEVFLFYYRIVERLLPENMKFIPLTPGGVFENVTWLMGLVPFSKALYRDRALVKDMFTRVGRVLEELCKVSAECEEVGAVTMGDDMGYRNGPIISPFNLKELVLPWQKRCAEAVHKFGKPFILHSCGNLKVLMEDLISYVGIDAKHSFEDASYPITEYKELYGDRIALLGGVDMDKLARMPAEHFVEYVKEVIKKCAPGGGYALGCGNSVANYVKLENYLAMLDVGKRYGKYPIK